MGPDVQITVRSAALYMSTATLSWTAEVTVSSFDPLRVLEELYRMTRMVTKVSASFLLTHLTCPLRVNSSLISARREGSSHGSVVGFSNLVMHSRVCPWGSSMGAMPLNV
jgi:hypothetical protein